MAFSTKEFTDFFYITKEQGAAYEKLYNAFIKAENSRSGEQFYKEALLSERKEQSNTAIVEDKDKGFGSRSRVVGVEQGVYRVDVDKDTAAKNLNELKEKAIIEYKKLYETLNEPLLKDHLADDIKQLHSDLGNAIKTGNYDKVDAYFDGRNEKMHREGRITIDIVKLDEIEMTNPKLPIAERLNVFANRTILAAKCLMNEIGVRMK